MAPASAPLALELLARRLSLTYRVRHRALTRRMRKIVRNRYRFVRTYGAVAPSQRVRQGLRLIQLLLPLSDAPTLTGRLTDTLGGLLEEPATSPLARLHAQHGVVAVTRLVARQTR